MGLKYYFNLHFRVNSLVPLFTFCYDFCSFNAGIFEKVVQKISKRCQNLIKIGNRHSNNNHDLLPALFFVSIDSYSGNPYWFSNYTSSFVSLVAKQYGDIVVGKLVYICLKFFS